MILRNGKVLNSTDHELISNEIRCSICSTKYEKGDIVMSCKKENLDKHSYHEECIKKHISINMYLGFKFCPYCLIVKKRFYKKKL